MLCGSCEVDRHFTVGGGASGSRHFRPPLGRIAFLYEKASPYRRHDLDLGLAPVLGPFSSGWQSSFLELETTTSSSGSMHNSRPGQNFVGMPISFTSVGYMPTLQWIIKEEIGSFVFFQCCHVYGNVIHHFAVELSSYRGTLNPNSL